MVAGHAGRRAFLDSANRGHFLRSLVALFHREGGSEKHLDDIAGMLRTSGADIDMEKVDELAAKRGLTAAWATAKARA